VVLDKSDAISYMLSTVSHILLKYFTRLFVFSDPGGSHRIGGARRRSWAATQQRSLLFPGWQSTNQAQQRRSLGSQLVILALMISLLCEERQDGMGPAGEVPSIIQQ
jgi:hypothetical protein